MLATSSSINPRPPPTPQNPSSTTQNPSNHSTHQPLQPPRRPRRIHRRNPFCTQLSQPHVSTRSSLCSRPLPNAPSSARQPPGRYFLVRAGESEYESIGVIHKNPVAKTSVDNGLSEKGKKQAVRSAFNLNEMGACDKNCWIWPASITQRTYPAAEIIAAVNGVSRSYIVPEYSFLDARGLEGHEGKNLEAVSEVYASDTLSPNESISDVFVRVIQLISISKLSTLKTLRSLSHHNRTI